MEGFAAVALGPGRVVFALADQRPLAVLHALGGVSVALAAAAHLQVGHGVEVGVPGQLRVVLVLVPEGVQAVEDHADVGGRHPVLQHRRVVEVVGGGPSVQRAEGDEAAAERPHVGVGVGADRLLLVLLGDDGPVGPVEHLLTLRGVELERRPGAAVVKPSRKPFKHIVFDEHMNQCKWIQSS